MLCEEEGLMIMSMQGLNFVTYAWQFFFFVPLTEGTYCPNYFNLEAWKLTKNT